MGRTLYDKIWDEHVIHTEEDGTSILYIDRHLVHEVTSPQAFEGLREAGRKVWRVSSIVATADHNTPTTGWEHGYDGITAYRRSKLAMVMWSFDLAAEQRVPVVSLHPGTFLDTGMVRQSGITPLGTARHGAEMVRIAAERALTGTTNIFFDELAPARCDEQAYDLSARRTLREQTDKLLSGS